jgi:hypothetical protein
MVLASARLVLVALLAFTLAIPIPALSGAASLGTARGIRGVELSLDGGKSWLPLGSRSLPVMDGAQIRATGGGAVIDLTDGSRLAVLPFTTLRFRDTGTATEVSLVYGRLTFQLPRQTRVEVRTATARLAPVRDQAMAGEIFLGGEGTLGLRMTQGTLQVEELAGAKRTMVASLEPVFLPKRPNTTAPLFTSDAQAAPPAGAKSVFSPKGESLGYLQPNGQLVVHPGYTSDLTQPFAPKLVQLAMAKVPEKDRSDAVPVFDVNGGYVGYVSGSGFYAQAQVAQAVGGPEGLGAAGWTGLGIAGAMIGAGIGYGIDAQSGGGGGGGVTTPLQPRR